jgi:two-component system sensor histidine kinase KdpD
MESKRPDPEMLLRQYKSDNKQRGKLKIFFGACAGAGKTYAMLLNAHDKMKENQTIVAGIIETHGRSETSKLLEGIKRLPLKEIQYQGITLKEFDIDNALVENPDILLIDELAHTNAIGSRHPKRWQDVEEILHNGIDVYTTLNVQHLESLNDTVTNITGIRVKETVPDSIFDNADEIILIDLPSEVILERLAEGKVYLGEFAKQRAAQNFFKMENLIALREIALRRTAERVDALRDIYQKYKDKRQLIAEKILVCINAKSISTKMIRTAKQQATRLKCPWAVLYVENADYFKLNDEEKANIEKILRLAEQLGAKTITLQEADVTHAILKYARENNFTRIILTKSKISKIRTKIFGNLIYDIIEKSDDIDIYIINEDSERIKPQRSKSFSYTPWWSYFSALFIICGCTLVGLSLKEWLDPENVVMLFLAGIVFVAATSERIAAMIASVLSVFLYKFFFTEPYYSIGTYHPRDIVTLGVLLLTALVISSLTSQLRIQNLLVRKREKFTADLYALSHKLIQATGKNKIAKVVSQHIGDAFESAVTVWVPDHFGHLQLTSHPNIKPDLKEQSAAQWAFGHNERSGLGTNTMPSARGCYLPLTSGNGVIGALGIIPADPKKHFSGDELMMLEALAIQTASALERSIQAEQSAPKIKTW